MFPEDKEYIMLLFQALRQPVAVEHNYILVQRLVQILPSWAWALDTMTFANLGLCLCYCMQ